MEKATYTLQEVGAILGVSTHAVRKMVDNGMLAAIELPKKILVPKKSLNDLLNIRPTKKKKVKA